MSVGALPLRPHLPVAAKGARLRRGTLGALVVLALVLRLAVVFATPHFVPVTDAGEFDHIAVSLAQTGSYPLSYLNPRRVGPTAFRPPLFPVALAGVYKLVGTGSQHTRWEAGRILEALLGAIAVGLICLIATRIWGPRAGLTAAAIAAVDPPLILVGSSLLSESLFIPLVLAAVWAALHYRDSGRLRWAATAGILVGLSALTRGNGALLIIPIGCLLWGVGRPRLTRQALAAPTLALAALVLVLAPWTIRNLNVFHQFVPIATETGYTLDGTFNAAVQNGEQRFPAMWVMPQARTQQLYAEDPHANEASISSTLTTEALHYIRAHPVSLLKTAYWNTVRMLDFTPAVERYFAPYERYPRWLAELSVYAFWVLLAISIAGLFGRAVRAAPLALWGVPLVIYLSTVLLLGLTRGRSPADPFLIMLAALAVVAARDRLAARRARSPAAAW